MVDRQDMGVEERPVVSVEIVEETESWIRASVSSATVRGLRYQVSIDPANKTNADYECPAFRFNPATPCKHIRQLASTIRRQSCGPEALLRAGPVYVIAMR